MNFNKIDKIILFVIVMAIWFNFCSWLKETQPTCYYIAMTLFIMSLIRDFFVWIKLKLK
jgi:hypothetical protein